MHLEPNHYERKVATIPADAPVVGAADAMRDAAVGSLVVVDGEGHPIGILTDRDLLERVIAAGRDVGSTSVSDVMSRPLHPAAPGDPLDRVVEVMSARGVRRVPIVRDGSLVGMVTLDDALAALADELHDVARGRRRALAAAARSARARDVARQVRKRARHIGEQIDGLGGEVKTKLARGLGELNERVRTKDD